MIAKNIGILHESECCTEENQGPYHTLARSIDSRASFRRRSRRSTLASDAPATLADWRGALVLVRDYLSASYYLCFLGLSSDSNTGYQDFEVELSRTSELIPCSSGHSNIVMDGVYRDDVGLSQHVHIRDLFQTRFLRYIRIPLYMFNSLMTMKHLR